MMINGKVEEGEGGHLRLDLNAHNVANTGFDQGLADFSAVACRNEHQLRTEIVFSKDILQSPGRKQVEAATLILEEKSTWHAVAGEVYH